MSGFNNSDLSALFNGGSPNAFAQFLKQQQDDQQRALMTQQLAMLNGLQSPQLPMPDGFALFLQQQKQLQALQSFAATNPYAMYGGFGGALPYAAPVAPLDSLALAKLLQGQAPQPAQAPVLPPHAEMLPNDRRRKGRTGTFPQKLHQMLSELEMQEGGAEIASFLPHGRAFAIHKPRDFVKYVMPKYFRMSRFSSFQRQLNLYDFQRITEGPEKGGYYHEMFVQGRPILCTMMKRNKIKGVKNQKKDGNNSEDEESKEDEEEQDE